MLLARLAVTAPWRGRGVVAGLLKDAMRRTLQAANIAGVRSFAVHAKGDTAERYYEHFGFPAAPSDFVPSIRADEGFAAVYEGRLGADINDNENVRRGQAKSNFTNRIRFNYLWINTQHLTGRNAEHRSPAT